MVFCYSNINGLRNLSNFSYLQVMSSHFAYLNIKVGEANFLAGSQTSDHWPLAHFIPIRELGIFMKIIGIGLLSWKAFEEDGPWMKALQDITVKLTTQDRERTGPWLTRPMRPVDRDQDHFSPGWEGTFLELCCLLSDSKHSKFNVSEPPESK